MVNNMVVLDLWISEYIIFWDIYVYGFIKVFVYKKIVY